VQEQEARENVLSAKMRWLNGGGDSIKGKKIAAKFRVSQGEGEKRPAAEKRNRFQKTPVERGKLEATD